MDNNNIKGLFDALAPSTAQKEKIYDKIVSTSYHTERTTMGGSMDTQPRRCISWLRSSFIGSAVCVAILLICVWTFPNLLNTPIENIPNNPIDTNTPTTPPNNGLDNPTTVTPNNPILGAAYYDVDALQIINKGIPASVPFGFFFANRLMDYANNKTGINLNNGVRWESGQFEIEDVGNALKTSVNTPVLPGGDYTIEQKIMIDEATGRTVAYQTVYIYFTLETMEFQRSFSIFYFSLEDFTKRPYGNLEQSENIVDENGNIAIHGFLIPPVVANMAMRVPQKRELVYLNNGIGIVVETITTPIMIDDGTVDETSTLERYEQSDSALISIMMSLVK